ncbi:helix-turn-helix domain-containing protein [Rariglobus hedericola]|uniref:Helix-turn-helix transcriptional regulator n=1 Tax=Rariglobus hedericola TaxID=2597822 RepID=A0A556QKY6_9BACT|nr:helix-turn-helix domain-containing protein [Rariglobus hedericola]TSJ77313.1 helix-turn-helix transcriptional regulator [Rariglobus hedericola]
MIASPPLRLSLHEWASLQTELIWVYDGVVDPEYRHLRTADGRAGYWARYVRSGQVRLSSPAGVLEAGPGQWLTGAREKGAIDVTDDARILSIHFLCQWPTGDDFFGKFGVRMISDEVCSALRKQAEQLQRSVRKSHPTAKVGYSHEQAAYPDFLRQQALFVNWLATWCETLAAQGCRPTYGGSGDERLTRVVRRLNESPMAAGFPKELLRAEAQLSPGQLDLKFVQAFGLSPWRYWERRRLEHAKRRLAQAEIPVKQVAYELGFKSDAHFVAWFRRLAGDAPGRFRAKPMGDR